MFATVEGIYENGQIILAEKPPIHHRTKVFVTFLDAEKPVKRVLGSWEGRYQISSPRLFQLLKNSTVAGFCGCLY